MEKDPKATVKSVDMTEEMQQTVIDLALAAVNQYTVEKDIAAMVKSELDTKFGPTWHCIVGKNFGSYVTHESKHFIYFYVGQLAVLAYKTA